MKLIQYLLERKMPWSPHVARILHCSVVAMGFKALALCC